jgi:hypothetical protein
MSSLILFGPPAECDKYKECHEALECELADISHHCAEELFHIHQNTMGIHTVVDFTKIAASLLGAICP